MTQRNYGYRGRKDFDSTLHSLPAEQRLDFALGYIDALEATIKWKTERLERERRQVNVLMYAANEQVSP